MKNEKEENNYDILFIGGVYEEGKEVEYLAKSSRGGIQNAVNTHQWNFIKGIDSNNRKPIDILSARYVESYPHYKDIYVRENKWHHVEGANDENIGFLNIKIVKNLMRKVKLEIKAKKWVKKHLNSDKVIICYYPSIPQMNATLKSKKAYKKIKTILIIPDIPKYMDLRNKKNKIKKIFTDWMEKKQDKLIKKFDGYILLTEAMADCLKIKEKPHIVIEGIVNIDDIKEEKNTKKFDKTSIVYSGSLHKKYGLENYINAIKQIKDKNVDFYIFGSGEMEEEIKNLAKVDSRVKFMGYRNREEVLEYQRKATLLINPRVTNEEFVKYSFPSKLVEYMLSGTPVLTTKLPSIPEEYYKYVYLIENETKEGIRDSLYKVLDLSENELAKKGNEAREFIMSNKNNIKQTKKIINCFNLSKGENNEISI